MNRTLAVSAFALLALPAYAADMYAPGGLKDSAIAVAAPSWTGPYAYVAGSVDAGTHDLSVTPAIASLSGLSAFGGGVEAGGGYDYQFNSHFLAGLWGYYGYSNASTSLTVGTATGSYDADGRWGFGGRIGYLPAPNALLYFNAGYGEEMFKTSGLKSDFSTTYSGFLVGGGAEYLLGNGFSAFVDYKAFLADTKTLASIGKVSLTDDLTDQHVTFGLRYKLGSNFAPLK